MCTTYYLQYSTTKSHRKCNPFPMKTSEGKIIHFLTRIWKSIQLKHSKNVFQTKEKNTQTHQRFKLCKPQKHKTPRAIYWTKERVAKEPCYQKMQPRNHGIKTCNQKPCQQNMQSKTVPAKDAIKNCAIKISNHKTCHQKMQSKNMPSKNVIKKHAICGWV
jgi:hypothetical protein